MILVLFFDGNSLVIILTRPPVKSAGKSAVNDFIICCEVIEHFHSPSSEFALLRKLLKPGGSLLCMTHLLPKKTAFRNWYYKNDPTHVIFYSEENIQWIKSNFNFESTPNKVAPFLRECL